MACNSMSLPSICYMPKLLPDELLYSLLARTVTFNACGNPRKSLDFLYGDKNILPSIDLPTRVGALQIRLGSFSPCSCALELVETTTLYPYHRPFLTCERHEAALHMILHGDAKGLKTLMGRVANGFGAAPDLQYCPACVRQDLSLYGSAYWHRSHHLPGVTVCLTHSMPLVRFATPSRTSDKQRLLLPPSQFTERTKPQVFSSSQLLFTQLSKDLLEAKASPIEPNLRSLAYRKALLSLGYAGSRGGIDYRGVACAVRSFYANFDGFSNQARLLSSPTQPLFWVRTLMERPEVASHPICHTLLIGFLFGSMDRFFEVLNKQVCEPRSEQVLMPAAKRVSEPRGEERAEHEHLLRDVSLSCRAIAQITQLSVTTVVSRRRALGIPIAERRKHLYGDLISIITEQVARGESPCSISAQHGVSLSTVYRIRAQSPAAHQANVQARSEQLKLAQRRLWIMQIEKYREAGVPAARRSAPSTYAWLYRNDRNWLLSSNSSFRVKPKACYRVNWEERDQTLSEKVRVYAKTALNLKVRGRLSSHSMIRMLGEAMVRSNRERLPSLGRELDRLAESKISFQLHRIDRAIQLMATSGIPMQLWRLQRLAGLREFSEALRSHVYNHPTWVAYGGAQS